MGLSVMGRNSDRKRHDCGCNYCEPPLPNPDPTRWHVLDRLRVGPYLVLKLHYPDCTNYEGVKILVYRNTYEEVVRSGTIDPHFNQTGISPLARFQPTDEGWQDAVDYARRKHANLR